MTFIGTRFIPFTWNDGPFWCDLLEKTAFFSTRAGFIEMPGKGQHTSKKLIRDKGSFKKKSILVVVICAFSIFLLTLLVYTPSLKNDFVWDDYDYVYRNNAIKSLNSQSLYWMLTSFRTANWHPLTWLSHAIDYALWGLKPWGHHLTNIILHGLNASLVFFLVVRLMLKKQEANERKSPLKEPLSIPAKSLIVAGVTALLFGLHPLHVESVAWVAERKDLLCALFFLLSILSYLSYASSAIKRDRWIWFNICLLSFILALMSKPMAVTLPLILLLLDLYPLKRFERYFHKNLSILLEKIPFFALSITSSVITIIAQDSGGAVRSLERMPLSFRLINGLHSLVYYLEKMIWPHMLVPFYPLPSYIYPFDLQYIMSGILVLATTGICLWMVKKGNYLFFTAWSYYIITLLPVLGIIQVGFQAAADRYTYLPSISPFLLLGLGVVLVWGKFSLTRFKTELRCLLMVAIFIAVFLLSYLTINQIRIWQDSEIFWNYVISAFPFPKSDPLAHYNLGVAYAKKGMVDEAIEEYKKVLSIKPHSAKAHYNLGVAYARKAMVVEATSEFKKAIAIKPNLVEAYYKLGTLLETQGKLKDAISAYREAIHINPHHLGAYNNLAWLYATNPNAGIRNGREAVALATKACELTGFKKAESLDTLAAAYAEQGNFEKAVKYQLKAIELASPQMKKELQKHLNLYKMGHAYRDQ